MSRPLRTTPLFTPPKVRRLKPLLAVLASGCAVAIVFFTVQFYTNRALPNTWLAGRDVSHSTKQQLYDAAMQQFKKAEFRFKSNSKEVIATPGELGVTLDIDTTVTRALHLRRNALQLLQMWQPAETPLVLAYDKAKMRAFLAHTFGAEFAEPVNARLHYNESLQEFQIIEGETGAGFAMPELEAVIESQAREPRAVTLHAHSQIEPERSALTVGTDGDTANRLLKLRLAFLYHQKVMYVAEPSDIASWLQFAPGNQPGKLKIDYDKLKIKAFLQHAVTASLNKFYGPDGSLVEPDQQPAQALQLTAVDDLVHNITEALTRQSDLEKELKVVS